MSRLLSISLAFLPLVLGSCSRKSDAARPSESSAPAAPEAKTPEAHRETCAAVMRRTRECKDTFVPGLMALRVRLDLPAGIKKRYETEGEKVMLALAHMEFAKDWSDEAIAKNCGEFATKPAADRERIASQARECLATHDCKAFTACDLAQKEKRWTTKAQ